jgi:DNA-binding transcriptional MerR regulator
LKKMRISELSARSGVSVATLKYYLREGLLHAGVATSATSATYDDTHLERVRLIRALLESGGLTIAAARKVTDALDAPPPGRHSLLGVAQYALSGEGTGSGAPAPAADALLEALGWQVDSCAPARQELESAITAASAGGLDLSRRDLSAYARAMRRVAEVDVRGVPRDSPAAALRHVVVGTVLVDPVLIALRRLAQEDVSSRQE